MENLESFLRAEIEPLQYAAFFGALMVLGVLEMWLARRRQGWDRRRRWPANFGLTALNIVVLGAIPLGGLGAADYAKSQGIGLMNMVEVAPVAGFAIGILFRSLVSWAVHMAMHKVPLLWRVHSVHHSDGFMDVSTTVRFHPLEFLITTPVVVAAVIAAGVSPVALLAYEILDAVMAVFTHANIRLPRWFERGLSWLLITPDMHRVHHSSWQPETDSNYGATLSIWDRLFGTFRRREPDDLVTLDLGLAEFRDGRERSIIGLLAQPFRRAVTQPSEAP